MKSKQEKQEGLIILVTNQLFIFFIWHYRTSWFPDISIYFANNHNNNENSQEVALPEAFKPYECILWAKDGAKLFKVVQSDGIAGLQYMKCTNRLKSAM